MTVDDMIVPDNDSDTSSLATLYMSFSKSKSSGIIELQPYSK